MEAIQFVAGSFLTLVAAIAAWRFGLRYSPRARTLRHEWRDYSLVLLLLLLALEVFPHVAIGLPIGYIWISPLPVVFGAMWLASRRGAERERPTPIH